MRYAIIGIILFGIALGFNLWLDHGCKTNGVITAAGRVCAD